MITASREVMKMTGFPLFLITCVIFVNFATAQTCGPNEVKKKTKDCISDCCPVAKGQPSACSNPCAMDCKCDLMYQRAANGTCIRAEDCPVIPCGENEKFDKCPGYCSEDCSNASADGKRCHFIGNVLITVICKPACRCIDDYWRNDDMKCVPYFECPQFQDQCYYWQW